LAIASVLSVIVSIYFGRKRLINESSTIESSGKAYSEMDKALSELEGRKDIPSDVLIEIKGIHNRVHDLESRAE
jgi:hypothetical protein